MTYNQLNSEISNALRNQLSLEPLKEKYQSERDKISAFLEMFLERFGGRVSGDKDDSPEWKLYNKKCQEYHDYTRAIRSVEYFISKEVMAVS
jgi:hypothetical protein